MSSHDLAQECFRRTIAQCIRQPRSRVQDPLQKRGMQKLKSWRQSRQLKSLHTCSAASFEDIFTLGGNILAAGSDTLQKLNRQFQPLPEDFPPGPSGDIVLRFLANPLGFLESMSEQYGSLIGMTLGGERVVVVADPTAAEQVLISSNTLVAKEGTAFFPGSKLAGNGLLVSDGPMWKRQRQLSNPAFRKTAVDTYSQAMRRGAQHLVQDVWQSGAREVYSDFNQITLQIVTDALFGFQASTPESHMVTNAVQIAMNYFAGRAAQGFAIPEWLPTPDNARYNEAVAHLDSIVYRIIAQRRTQPTSESSEKCLLDNLLASKDEFGSGMTDKALRDELMTLLIAGQETSAIVLAWTCALLAQNPTQQHSVRQELDDKLGDADITPESVRELHYLEAVVLESLRLQPPAYLVGRCTKASMKLSSFTLPKGTTTLVSPYLLHRDRRKWVQSQEFRPQRWMEHLEGHPPGNFMSLMSGLGPNGSYLPFGAGPRNCIGNYFAMTEVVLIMAHILKRFKLTFAPGAKFPAADAKITLRPTNVDLELTMR